MAFDLRMLGAFGRGLASGDTVSDQIAGGFSAIADQRRAQNVQNKTLELLGNEAPEIAQAVTNGLMTPQEGFTAYYKAKQEQLKAQTPNRKFQTLADGTYGFADENAGTFTPMGKATKPSDSANNYADRQAAAAQYGLTPDDPRYQQFVLSGKFPREDQAPLSATDKKAILEADEMVLSSRAALPLIDKAIDLNDKAYDGFGAGMRGMVTGAFGNEAGLATQELDNTVTANALGQLKAIFGAAPTEGERKILLDVEGSVNQPAPVRKAIFERAKAAAERRLQFYQQRADEIRGGSYYKPGGQQAPNQGNRTSTGTSWKVVD